MLALVEDKAPIDLFTLGEEVRRRSEEEARISPGCQSYRVLTGQERERHFGLTRVDPERPFPATLKWTPQSSMTGLICPTRAGT